MRVSVFTPSHAPTYLDQCWRSLLAQTYDDWEWIVLLNGGATWTPESPDPRIRIVHGGTTGKVGAAKREACALADGEILLELDHDDVLAPDCLEAVVAAFAEHPEVVLVYSDFAQIDEAGATDHTTFNLAMGWEYAPANVAGRTRQPLQGARTEPAQRGLHLVRAQPRAGIPAGGVRAGRRVRRGVGGARRPGPDDAAVRGRAVPAHPTLPVPAAGASRQHPEGQPDQPGDPERDRGAVLARDRPARRGLGAA
ncbi:glycosyltransferase [Nocardioides convexus]|uniref:glycosyltransferase n=1 Tax=Nocardioides convexus TaxID=2712224 RepID=UPI0024187DB4|nr:glycosyltransferase [Nocardioides convexus]